MRQASHRQASETRWRFAADPAVARPPATLSRTIATCREPVSRQTKAPPARSPLRPPQTTCPNPHSESRRRHRSTSRGFLPCRVPDAGPGARGISDEGRHPEPSTSASSAPVLRSAGARNRTPQTAHTDSQPPLCPECAFLLVITRIPVGQRLAMFCCTVISYYYRNRSRA